MGRSNHQPANSRSKRKTFKIERFLPKDERVKTMTTDKLWYCHGSLMLERYRLGKDISGMLEHNCFIAEKVSTKAYLPSGIIKYDEAVREIAKDKGGKAYSAGDMGLAMRFLSTEYSRPKPPNPTFSQNRPGYQRKPFPTVSFPNRDGRDKGKAVCWLFNGNGCPFDNCKFLHVCSRCNLSSHNVSTCRVNLPTTGSNPSQNPRT